MDYGEALKLLRLYGQEHLLEYYGELDDCQKNGLLKQIGELDLSVLDDLKSNNNKEQGKLSPIDALSVNEIKSRSNEFEKIGLSAIKAGKVAAVLLAGGQGTRLGWNAPKGTFNIGVNKTLSIFACQFNNLLKVAKKAGAYPHVFVMTSTVNDGQTKSFFKQNSYFGYEPEKIHFYVQKTAPAIDKSGKILLEEKHKIAVTPNGNGGWYSSLSESECGKIVDEEGIEWLNVYGVDNVLQKICDPVFVGATIKSGLNSSGKVVKKAAPDEKVGVLCKEDGLPTVVEYYELPETFRTETDLEGELLYKYGVILNYLFKVEKLKEIGAAKLPYHLALKKVACVQGGKKVIPDTPNAYKLETLAVDIVKLMGSCLGFEVVRNEEFAPVKNAEGVDSVQTARELLKLNGIEI